MDIGQPKDVVQPRPQKVRCEQHKTKEAKFVAIQQGKEPIPIFASKKYLNELQSKNQKIPYFKIDDTFDDWKNLYQYFSNDYYSNLNYYCKYISDQSFNLQLKDIDQKVDKLQDAILEKLDLLRDELKSKLIKHQEYYKQKVEKFTDPYNSIKDEYEKFKHSLSTLKSDDQESLKSLKQSLQAFVKKAVKTQSREDFKQDRIVVKTDDLRKSQPLYINSKIWDSYQQMIERSITELQESYIQNNPFNETQIANKGFIFQIFQRIKQDPEFQYEPQKLQHLLTNKLKNLFQCSSQDLLESLYKYKDDLKNNVVIALIRTTTDQSIGFYYNSKRKTDSLLFSLTKHIVLPLKAGFELKMADHDQDSPTLTFGKDLVITNDFKKCSSNLGDAFDLRGEEYKIGNQAAYLANGVYFDIEYFELYRVEDIDLLKPQGYSTVYQPPIIQSAQTVIQSAQPVIQSAQPVIQSAQPVIQSTQPFIQLPIQQTQQNQINRQSFAGISANTLQK